MYVTKVRTRSAKVNRFCTGSQNFSMSELIDVAAVIDRLCDLLGIEKGWGQDSALAQRLGYKSNSAIGNWRRRGTIDHDKVFGACKDAGGSFDWVYYGRGEMMDPPTTGGAVVRYHDHDAAPIAPRTGEPPAESDGTIDREFATSKRFREAMRASGGRLTQSQIEALWEEWEREGEDIRREMMRRLRGDEASRQR